MTREICEDCGKTFYAGQNAHLCLECKKERLSRYAKDRNLNKLPLFEERMWTCTPWSCNPTYAVYVRNVYSDGTLYNSIAGYANGCVPACIFTIHTDGRKV